MRPTVGIYSMKIYMDALRVGSNGGVAHLSGGKRTRCTVCPLSNLICFFDEPTNHLDAESMAA